MLIIVIVMWKVVSIVMGTVHYDSDCGDCDCESIALSVHIPPRWLHKGEVQALQYGGAARGGGSKKFYLVKN